MVKNHILERVHKDNLRIVQIGEIEDGISHEVAEDIGYLPAERTADFVKLHQDAEPEWKLNDTHRAVGRAGLADARQAMAARREQ